MGIKILTFLKNMSEERDVSPENIVTYCTRRLEDAIEGLEGDTLETTRAADTFQSLMFLIRIKDEHNETKNISILIEEILEYLNNDGFKKKFVMSNAND